MEQDIAVGIYGISKDFRLPSEKYYSLKSHIIHPFKRRSFQYQHALRDINVEIKKGEFFGIVGRNGSGKSTLLKIIAGVYQPTKGEIKHSGKLVPFIELGVGFNPELTGQENVYLNGALLGFSEKEIEAMYEDIVGFAELERFMGQKLKNYSSGMQVRLAFSMAVRAKADILLIDEVLAVGDADFQRKCFEYFKKLKKDKITVVFVSHNMEAVREYCDRAMIIEDSYMLDIGNTDKIAAKYQQLFMVDEAVPEAEAEARSDDRWGDKAASTTSITAKATPHEIIIKQIIEVKSELVRPVAGFRIRNGAGKDITGTNTKKQHKPLADFKPGQSITLTWSLPNILSDGKYTIDPSVLHDNEVTVSDWWNDATSFTIKRQRHLPYDIDPGFDVDIQVKQH